MLNKHRIFQTGFGDLAFEIACNNQEAYDLTSFLFTDLPGAATDNQPKRYDLILGGPQEKMSLWEEDRKIYSGDSWHQLARVLMNAVIFQCVNTNDKQHALHAAAVFKDSHCIILPGKSGRGKSTLTTWLITNGYRYLTDELVLLSKNGSVYPFVRPISLKVSNKHESWPASVENEDQIISSDDGSIIPHRLLNPDFSVAQPLVTDIIFADYKAGSEAVFLEVSAAKSSFLLMQSHVNARNIKGHGLAGLSAIVRKCRSFKLTYSSFDELPPIFNSFSSPFLRR